MNSLLFSTLLFNLLIIINALPSTRRPTENAQFYQGDMRFETSLSRTLATTNNRVWPNGIVPYVISSEFTTSEIALIEESMRMIESKTGMCMTFRRRVSSDSNWISIVNKQGCWSYVGRNTFPGEQEVSIQKIDCMYKGTIVHELLHAMGFWHEQSRPDRDNFVRINLNNIRSDLAHNFNKETNSQTFNLPYDLNSIMHYENNAFSTNGRPTIEALNGQRLIAAYDKTDAQILSELDVQAIRAFYSCASTNVVTTNNNITSSISSATTVRPISTTVRPLATTVRPLATTVRPLATTVRPLATTVRPLATTVRPLATTAIPFQPFSFTIINRLRFTIRLYWLNFQGQNQLYGTLAPNSQITQSSFTSHVWLLSSGDTRYNRRFVVGSDPSFLNNNTVFIAQ